MEDVHVGVVCRTILEVIEAALEDCERRSVESYVAAGMVAWDQCCGLLVVAPERIYRTGRFPAEGPDANDCYDGLIAVQVVVLLLRCVPVLTDQGQAPTPAELDAAYNDALIDAAIVWDTLSDFSAYETANLSQIFTGAEGGCIAIESRLTLGIDGDRWCGPCGT